jgi:hypothetical protein
MKRICKAITVLVVLCGAMALLSGCSLLSQLFKKEPEDNRTLTVSVEGDCYVNEYIPLIAKWDNGEAATDAVFQIVSGEQYAFISGASIYSMEAGVFEVTAQAQGITSAPLQITIVHSAASLETLLNQRFANTIIDAPYNLSVVGQEFSVEVDNTDIAHLEDNFLTMTGIGEAALSFKTGGDTLLTYTVSTLNPFTSSVFEELKRTGAIEQDAEYATRADFALAEELNLAGKMYAHGNKADFLKWFTSLRRLNLADCNLNHLGFLNAKDTLEYLDLSGNQILSLAFLPDYSELEYLDISDNMIAENEFARLAELTKLKTLKVGGNDLPEDFDDIAQALDLEELEKDDYTRNTPETLADIEENLLAEYDSFADYKANYLEAESGRKPNVIVRLAGTDYNLPEKTIVIPEETERIEIIGQNTAQTLKGFIAISSRADRLILIIENLKINAPDFHSAIEAPVNSYLKIVVKGNNELRGGKGRHGISGDFIEITSTKEGAEEHSLVCIGGPGGNGNNSGSTSTDSNASRKGGQGGEGGSGLVARLGFVIRRAYNLAFEGGHGGDGGDGGEYKTSKPLDPSTWLRKNGDGGNGGRGGDGYRCPQICILIGAAEPELQGGQGGQGGEGCYHVDQNYRGTDGYEGADGFGYNNVLPEFF